MIRVRVRVRAIVQGHWYDRVVSRLIYYIMITIVIIVIPIIVII